MDGVEPYEYRLGSTAGSIYGIAERLLQRPDLDEEVATHLCAIRDLARGLIQEEERRGSAPTFPALNRGHA